MAILLREERCRHEIVNSKNFCTGVNQPCEVLVVHCDSSKETRLREYLINAFPFLTLMPPPADYQACHNCESPYMQLTYDH